MNAIRPLLRRFRVVILAAVVLLTACGSDSTVAPTPTPVSELDAHEIASLDNGPTEGGTLRLFSTAPDTLHPLRTSSRHVLQMVPFLFDSLVTVDAERRAELLLATSVRNVDGGTIWDIELRDGVRFHDGSAMTVQDVLYTMNAIRETGPSGSWWLAVADMDSVQAVDVRTLRVILRNPDADYVRRLTFPVLPERTYAAWPAASDGESSDWTSEPKPVGSGAFRFDSADDGTIRLVRNDDWWNTSTGGLMDHPVWIDAIEFLIHDAGSDLITAFQRQAVDIAEIHELDVDRYSQRTDLHIGKYAANQLEFAVVGSRSLFLKDAELRRILFSFLSWKAEKDGFSEGDPLLSLWNGGVGESTLEAQAAFEALAAAGYKYDENRKILYGYAAGARRQVSATIQYNRLNVERLGTAEWIADSLAELGIAITATGASEAEEEKLAASGKFDLLLLGCSIPTYADTDDTLPLLTGRFAGMAESPSILPLYRKQAAVLYQLRVRGEKNPVSWDIYNGWKEWYLITTPDAKERAQ